MLGVQRGTVGLIPCSPEWERRFGGGALLFRGYLRRESNAKPWVRVHAT